MNFKSRLEIVKIAKQHFPDWVITTIYPLFSKAKVLKKSGTIVAFALYSFGKLHYFAVDENHQAKGFGNQLFNEVKQNINRLNVRPSNQAAIHLYKKHGFEKVKEIITWSAKKRSLMRISIDKK